MTQVYLLKVPVYKETDSLCSKHACPIEPGALKLVDTTLMPAITPKGRYDIKAPTLSSSAPSGPGAEPRCPRGL